MREIGKLETRELAELFSDYLYAQDIANEIEGANDGSWLVWVHSEDELGPAEELLKRFRADPTSPEFARVAADAEKKKERAAAEEAAARKRMIQGSSMWSDAHPFFGARLTIVLIVLSVTVALISKFGADYSRLGFLFISEHGRLPGTWWQRLPEIRAGQVWRLVTPILIHFGPIHILFNMMWLRDLGSAVERQLGTLRYAVIVLVAAVLSNVGQFIMGGPGFGGMSGVVFALLGYVWIRGKYDPGPTLRLHQSTVTMMLIWYFLCLFRIVPQVANTAHTLGALVGMAWGFLDSGQLKRMRS